MYVCKDQYKLRLMMTCLDSCSLKYNDFFN